MAKTFQLVSLVIVLGIFIGLVVFCKKKIVPKCPCCQKFIGFIKAKLMYNSVLRSMI